MKYEELNDVYNSCIKNLDSKKDCFTCLYLSYDKDCEPCNNCFNEVLGFPVNPTNWKKDEK